MSSTVETYIMYSYNQIDLYLIFFFQACVISYFLLFLFFNFNAQILYHLCMEECACLHIICMPIACAWKA